MSTVFNRLGPYEVQREIGRGGMAMVVLAVDTRTGRQVALKLVQHATSGEAREIVEAEQSGAELQRQFSQISQHVPGVYEHLPNESGYFVVAMEYLDGENLSDLIARGPIPVDRAVAIAVELCTFLEAAHGFEAVIGDRKVRSLVHGDLKPQNVRITSTGSVKVLDFGIAKALSLSRKVTRNDFGTTPYLSPERLDGDVNEFADLWAVGVMLHEMVRGRRPFDAPDTRRLERLIRARVPPLPLTGHSPVGLEAIVAKLLGPSPSLRYDSARAAREDLERFTSGRRTIAEEQGWPNRLVDQEPTRRTRPTADEGEPTRRTQPETGAAAARVRSSAIPAGGVTAPGAARGRGEAGSRATVQQARRARPTFARLVLMAAMVVGLATFANECGVAREARQVAARVPTRELHQLGDVWNAYDQLAARSNLGFGTSRLGDRLTDHTLALVNRVIANYRLGLPTIREAQWQSARDALVRALRIDPGDRLLRAAYQYCVGHLHRINGEADKSRNQDAEAQRELAEAIASFREAAELRPDWPDPFLGLARTFIYGLEDVDLGADAMAQAARRGFVPTDRETSQLADGYRTRGNSLIRSARELAGAPQESDYLARAIDGYQRALVLYTQAASLPTATSNIRITQRALDQAQWRLDLITPAAPEAVEPDFPLADPQAPGEGTGPEPSSGPTLESRAHDPGAEARPPWP
jgi:tRNA A-37 threonylcarbamoyl transferase component Bud32